jgi:hypothetical protein
MTVKSQNTPPYLLIRSGGRLKNEKDLFKHAKKIFSEFEKHGNPKILIDALATQFPLDLFPYYDLVQYYMESLPPRSRELKVAALIGPEYVAAGEFWQNAANNRGFNYRAFTSVKDAEEWLGQIEK